MEKVFRVETGRGVVVVRERKERSYSQNEDGDILAAGVPEVAAAGMKTVFEEMLAGEDAGAKRTSLSERAAIAAEGSGKA